MTHIAPLSLKTKKMFKEAVARNPKAVYLSDPAIVNPLSGSVAVILQHRETITVTNHPKRSWFVCITKNESGKIVIY